MVRILLRKDRYRTTCSTLRFIVVVVVVVVIVVARCLRTLAAKTERVKVKEPLFGTGQRDDENLNLGRLERVIIPTVWVV